MKRKPTDAELWERYAALLAEERSGTNDALIAARDVLRSILSIPAIWLRFQGSRILCLRALRKVNAALKEAK